MSDDGTLVFTGQDGDQPTAEPVLPDWHEGVAYQIDMNKITLGDLEIFDKAGKKDADGNPAVAYAEILEVLIRAIRNVNVRTIPVSELQILFKKLGEAVAEASNPNPSGEEMGNSAGG